MLVRFQMIWKDKITRYIIMCSLVAFTVLISVFSLEREERSSIPIGLFLEEETPKAIRFREEIKQIPSLYIYEKTKEELDQLLKQERIFCYFIIPGGYEEQLKSANTKGLIQICVSKNEAGGMILTDIVTGILLQDIGSQKAWNLYKKTMESLNYAGIERESYNEIIEDLLKDTKNAFSFEIQYVNKEEGVSLKQDITNGILYQQLICCMISIFLSFILLFFVRTVMIEKEEKILVRKKIICNQSIWKRWGLEWIIFSGIGSLFSCYFLLLLKFCFQLSFSDYFINGFFACLLYCILISFFFLSLIGFCNHSVSFLLSGIILIILNGFSGFYYLVSELLESQLLNFLKLLPNYWFIQTITDIIL